MGRRRGARPPDARRPCRAVPAVLVGHDRCSAIPARRATSPPTWRWRPSPAAGTRPGSPALAVGWGPIGDAGTLARNAEVSEALARRLGTAHLRAADALDALPAMLASGLPVVHFAQLAAARRHQLPLLASTLFERLPMAASDAPEAEADLRGMVAGRTPQEARQLVTAALTREVGRHPPPVPEPARRHKAARGFRHGQPDGGRTAHRGRGPLRRRPAAVLARRRRQPGQHRGQARGPAVRRPRRDAPRAPGGG